MVPPGSLIAGLGIMVLSCLANGRPALADELRTHSGETLVGTIVEEHPDYVVFDSAALGRLTIRRELILGVTPQPRPPSKPAAADAPTPPARPAEAPAQVATTVSAEDDDGGMRHFLARINPLKGWKTRLDFGFIARRGDDSDNDLTLRFRSRRETQAGNEHQLEGRYYYAEDVLRDRVTLATDELLTAAYRYRHELGPPYFAESRSSYYRDVIKELDHEVTQTFGLGVRFEGESWRLSLVPAAGVQWREVAGEDNTAVVVGAYQEFGLDITRSLRLGQSIDYLVVADDADDYSVRLAIELNQKLGELWSLAVRYDYTYDAIVGRDASEYQHRLSLTLGLDL